MIEKGEKREEYRENKLYWCKRLYVNGDWKSQTFRPFKHVTFSCGYTRRSMTFEVKGILKTFGKPEWGAPQDKMVFAIVLGNRIDNPSTEQIQEKFRVVVKYENGEKFSTTTDDNGMPLTEDTCMSELEYWAGEKTRDESIEWVAAYHGSKRIG